MPKILLIEDEAPIRATLSLDLQGMFGGLWGRATKDITERYIALEAQGLKARSQHPEFRHASAAR